jgi:hypothetical protein
MALVYVAADNQQEKMLDRSQKKVRECIQNKKEMIPGLLLTQLSDMFDSQHPRIEVEIKDDEGLRLPAGKADDWAWGSGAGEYVEINSRCFVRSPRKRGGKPEPPRLTAVLLHELVHAAGGEELDAEFFENSLFGPQDGATLPSRADEENFQESGYKGVFVRMDPQSREVSDLESLKVLGTLKPNPINARHIKNLISRAPQPNRGEDTMAGANQQEKLAAKRIATMDKRPKQLGVHVVVEFTGYLDKVRLDTFMNGIRTTLSDHLEGNGGGG